ncbi:Sterol 24-C-methyltransferase erg-4 [Escovopsis weberi]|uniref:Sterol 24-C-methyltransferase n=1 Tax=Escovopsis weberi TaxID=150374 RepID=A0A0M8N395_ESCWE|nr:Sterol 24-C-methyltransferase erg-4 [Escovopsis weberi]
MAPTVVLEKQDKARDAAYSTAMHGESAKARRGISAMFAKASGAEQVALDEFFQHWEDKPAETETAEQREARKSMYATLTRQYYNLSTDLYEYGWGQCFHFCRFSIGEPFYQATARHEHYLAHSMGIKEGYKVLDVGCGVGGPAREIAKFTGCHITGLNNNDYQIARATNYAKKEQLSDQLSFVKGDFMQMEFPDNTFDAAYAIEATCHAPSLEGVYSQIYRVIKPGGVFGVYEWLMTDDYDNDNLHHRAIRLGIEQGNGISNMCKIEVAVDAMKAAGFDLLHHEDLADRPATHPWWWPLDGDLKCLQIYWDFFNVAQMTRVGRFCARQFTWTMESIGLFPKGVYKAMVNLEVAADNLVAGGKEHLFTPMYLMIGRKPAE